MKQIVKKMVNSIIRYKKLSLFSYNYLYKSFIIDEIKKAKLFYNNKIVLDYGCGKVPYFDLFNDVCKKYIGIDFNAPNITHHKFRFHNINEIAKLKIKVDFILSTQVIVELDDLKSYLNNINQFSEKGTVLFISSPWFQPIGYNDKARYSPFYLRKILEKEWDFIL